MNELTSHIVQSSHERQEASIGLVCFFASGVSMSVLFSLPHILYAGTLTEVNGGGGVFTESASNAVTFISNALIPFIVGIAFLVFVWGVFRYFIVGGANKDDQEQARMLMIYGVLAFVLMIVFWGVVNLLAESTNLQGKSNDFDSVQSPF